MWLWVPSTKDAAGDDSRIELVRMVINNYKSGYTSKEAQMNQFVEALGGLFDNAIEFSKVAESTKTMTGMR